MHAWRCSWTVDVNWFVSLNLSAQSLDLFVLFSIRYTGIFSLQKCFIIYILIIYIFIIYILNLWYK